MDHHHYHLHTNCNRVNDFRMVCFQGGVQEITVRFLRVVRDSLRLCVFARTYITKIETQSGDTPSYAVRGKSCNKS